MRAALKGYYVCKVKKREPCKELSFFSSFVLFLPPVWGFRARAAREAFVLLFFGDTLQLWSFEDRATVREIRIEGLSRLSAFYADLRVSRKPGFFKSVNGN